MICAKAGECSNAFSQSIKCGLANGKARALRVFVVVQVLLERAVVVRDAAHHVCLIGGSGQPQHRHRAFGRQSQHGRRFVFEHHLAVLVCQAADPQRQARTHGVGTVSEGVEDGGGHGVRATRERCVCSRWASIRLEKFIVEKTAR